MGYNGLSCRIVKHIFNEASIFTFLINVQNARVANILDIVRRGLGMLPQQAEQAIFEKSQEGIFSKMSKLVHVYTACEFVKWYLFTLLAQFTTAQIRHLIMK